MSELHHHEVLEQLRKRSVDALSVERFLGVLSEPRSFGLLLGGWQPLYLEVGQVQRLH